MTAGHDLVSNPVCKKGEQSGLELFSYKRSGRKKIKERHPQSLAYK